MFFSYTFSKYTSYVHLEGEVPVYLPGLNPTLFPAPKPRVITVVHFRATTQTRRRTPSSRLRQRHYCDTALVAVTSHFPSKWWRACFGLCLQNRHRSRRVFQSIDREQECLRLWRRGVECLDMLRSILQTFCPGFWSVPFRGTSLAWGRVSFLFPSA